MTTYRSKILATGSAFPANRVTNADLAQRVETNDEWIVERTGIRARRVADAAKGELNSELALRASKQALDRAGLSATDIDFILYATVSPDHVMPNTACVLQEKLGAKRAGALDISAACSGFVYALSIADAFIKTGQYRNILVIGAEVLSPMVNWDDRGTCILFGDGAGVAVLSRAPEGDASQIYSTHLYADGWSKELFFVPAGGTAMPVTHEVLDQKLHLMQMKGREIYKVAVRMLADCATEALTKNGFTVKDVDWLVPHQANLRIIEAVAKRLDFPMEKVIVNIEEFANTSAATVPTAFDEAVTNGKIKRGDLVLFDVFGAGLTYGSALLRY
ncbi:MAG: ketoacyl-ACP synthase III [Deltaproteobacteria bacterium]|nr:ketoacyl-ACP synthase III [Deltaproteobacteria bacterium]